MTLPVHFYHIFCGNKQSVSAWEAPVSDHFRRLREARFTGTVCVTLVGEWSYRASVKQWLKENCPAVEVYAETEYGHEQFTLSKIRRYSDLVPFTTPVYYAHPKGSYHPSPFQDNWRRGMEGMLTDDWDLRVDELRTYDAVGLHWLTPQQFEGEGVTSPFFGGNFWWATAGYLAGLPEPSTETRHHAEAWIGQGSPKVLDLCPGWPTYSAEVSFEQMERDLGLR